MAMRTNYYKDLPADYSKPGLVSAELGQKLLRNAEKYIALREDRLPEIGPAYNLERVERENKEWWPTHCEALRQGRGELLAEEYARELVYFCADGPFYGRNAGTKREANWWAILAQPGVTVVWPIVMFHGEVVYFEWKCIDDETGETVAKGNVTWLRRGHRGACYLKCEQLTFYRDVYAPPASMEQIKRS
ncbi:MAG: hypothetical protein ACJ797_25490 [Ktedonobacteraceae bacterium]